MRSKALNRLTKAGNAVGTVLTHAYWRLQCFHAVNSAASAAACDAVSSFASKEQHKGCKAGLAAVASRLTVLQDVSAALPLSCLFFSTLTNCNTGRQLQKRWGKRKVSSLRIVHFHSDTPFLHWKPNLSDAWGHHKTVSTLGRCCRHTQLCTGLPFSLPTKLSDHMSLQITPTAAPVMHLMLGI